MLPLAAPAVAAVAILTFQGIWNEFFWANLLLTRDNSNYTVQMGLAQFRFQYQTLWPQLMAAATIAILPVLVVYVFFQRYFVAGVRGGGVKDDRRGGTAARRGRGAAGRCPRLLRGVLALRALNSVLSAYVLGVLAVAAVFPVALVLLLGVGPLLAARLRGRHRGRDRFAHVHRDDRGSSPLLRARARVGAMLAAGILATVVAFAAATRSPRMAAGGLVV